MWVTVHCCRMCDFPYEHSAHENGTGFESPSVYHSDTSLSTVSVMNLTVQALASQVCTSRNNHCCLRCESHGPAITTSVKNLTSQTLKPSLWTSGSHRYCLRYEPQVPTITVSVKNLTLHTFLPSSWTSGSHRYCCMCERHGPTTTVSVKNLTVQTLPPPLWTSGSHHYREAYGPTVTASDMTLTKVPLCASGGRPGY